MEDTTIEAEATATPPMIAYSNHCQAGLHQHCDADWCLCDCHLCDEDE
jgi:hypothetical protein